jgi:hypothetical protein
MGLNNPAFANQKKGKDQISFTTGGSFIRQIIEVLLSPFRIFLPIKNSAFHNFCS